MHYSYNWSHNAVHHVSIFPDKSLGMRYSNYFQNHGSLIMKKIHERSVPLQSIDSKEQEQEQDKKPRPSTFCTEIITVSTPENTQEINQERYLQGVPVSSFDSLGEPIYVFADETGHKYFDICDFQRCLMESSDEEGAPRRRRRKKSLQQKPKKRYESGDPQVGLLGKPSGKNFEYYVLYLNGLPPTTPDIEETQLSYMFGPSSFKTFFKHKNLNKVKKMKLFVLGFMIF
ncbi:hypothetical protein V5N11_028006 [Cardamine amara subsp. amara]|uniref:Uncharacterized protein n=1 Tax=Cardamine amara subsp. amara TaxID=228776 RepID=A0ABD1AMB3_CARAN